MVGSRVRFVKQALDVASPVHAGCRRHGARISPCGDKGCAPKRVAPAGLGRAFPRGLALQDAAKCVCKKGLSLECSRAACKRQIGSLPRCDGDAFAQDATGLGAAGDVSLAENPRDAGLAVISCMRFAAPQCIGLVLVGYVDELATFGFCQRTPSFAAAGLSCLIGLAAVAYGHFAHIVGLRLA